jgi:hypothetical protein
MAMGSLGSSTRVHARWTPRGQRGLQDPSHLSGTKRFGHHDKHGAECAPDIPLGTVCLDGFLVAELDGLKVRICFGDERTLIGDSERCNEMNRRGIHALLVCPEGNTLQSAAYDFAFNGGKHLNRELVHLIPEVLTGKQVDVSVGKSSEGG